ncbi:hypothetical protein HYU07_07680 [Candidatus Woesearchaeota archaeon]|nr:hypothetical protein [Candidatus Woesearchaeota archaeon]
MITLNKNQIEIEVAKILDNAATFVSRLKDIDKTLSKELVLSKLNKKTL